MRQAWLTFAFGSCIGVALAAGACSGGLGGEDDEGAGADGSGAGNSSSKGPGAGSGQGGSLGVGGGTPMFETDIVPILNKSCGAGDNACHSAVAYAAIPD